MSRLFSVFLAHLCTDTHILEYKITQKKGEYSLISTEKRLKEQESAFLLFKHLMPSFKNGYTLLTELLQRANSLLVSFLYFRMRLTVKFICITDNLLFQGLWHKIHTRQRQCTLSYLRGSQSRSCMALCHACMLFQSLCTKEFSTQPTMTDVRLLTLAQDTLCICLENSDIMEHAGLIEEGKVDLPFRMGKSDGQGTTGNLSRMADKQSFQFGLTDIILMDKLKRINHSIEIGYTQD